MKNRLIRPAIPWLCSAVVLVCAACSGGGAHGGLSVPIRADPTAGGGTTGTLRTGIPIPPNGAMGGADAALGGASSTTGGAASAASGGGAASAGSAGTPSAVLPVRCKSGLAWQDSGPLLPVPASDLARFSGVTGDELTLAWTSASGDAFVADRSIVTDAFGAAARVNGETALAADRAALSPTGTSLVAFRADRGGFVGFSRKSHTAPWTASPGLEFANLAMAFEGGALGSEPVLSSDKSSLFYLITRKSGTVSLYESRWLPLEHAWGIPSSPSSAELVSSDSLHLRRPTGTSVDGLTLFFYDDALKLERAAWRATVSAEFSVFEDVGQFPNAVPDARCTALYYQAVGGSGVSVAEW